MKEVENDPVAMAFAAILVGLFAKLNANHVLSQKDIREIFEVATHGLEEMGIHTSPQLAKAHSFLQDIEIIIDAPLPKHDE